MTRKLTSPGHHVGETLARLRGDEGRVVPALALGRERVDLVLLGRDGLLEGGDLLALGHPGLGCGREHDDGEHREAHHDERETGEAEAPHPAARRRFTAEGDRDARRPLVQCSIRRGRHVPLLRSVAQAVKRGNALRPA